MKDTKTVSDSELRQPAINEIIGLLMQFSWSGRRQFGEHLAEHRLTPPQFYTLAYLMGPCDGDDNDKGIAIHLVAEGLHKERATMTGILDRLERAGLVERHRSQVDRRKWLVSPTDEGRRLVRAAGKSWHRSLVRSFDDLGTSELAELESLLRRLVEAMTPADMSALPAHVFAHMMDSVHQGLGDDDVSR
ncbi:MAG: MarR family transcriptional regulator [Chloroflexota bacterium]|nr:MarR family transcriptional regulator [Chloroflexota bacterium]